MLLGLFGIVVTIVLVARKVPGALILSILLATVVGLFLPGGNGHVHITDMPQHFFSRPNSMMPVAFKLDLGYVWHHPSQSIPIVLALLFTDLFSAMAVLFGVGARAGLNGCGGESAEAAAGAERGCGGGFGWGAAGIDDGDYLSGVGGRGGARREGRGW